MVILLAFTGLVILLYLAYPLWLVCLKPAEKVPEAPPGHVEPVSVILLSYNGSRYLKDKIEFLLGECSSFDRYELIIIDDGSDDGSGNILEPYLGHPHIRIIRKESHCGIPHSMNLAVQQASHELIVFCDQRQVLSENILRKLTGQMHDLRIGAVSACISDHDKLDRFSFVRSYENYIKGLESRAGCLIGVYGPLFCLRKSQYSPLPQHIILDDLHLTLKILAKKQVKMMAECLITDENLHSLHDYHRARRYVLGFLQILREKRLIRELSIKQRIMLFWHKYLRLHIPLLMLACLIGSGWMSMRSPSYTYFFLGGAGLLLVFMLPVKFNLFCRIRNIIKINFYYLFAFIEVNAGYYFRKRKANPNFNEG